MNGRPSAAFRAAMLAITCCAARTAVAQDHSMMHMPMPAEKPAAKRPVQHPPHEVRGTPPAAKPATLPVTPIPVLTGADRIAARPPQDGSHPAHDNSIQSYTLFDRLEASNANPGSGLEWQGRTWIGTDLNRVWLRSEGERANGITRSADLELFYGRSIATWWDVLIGGRHDFKPGASQDFAAIGLVGTAPYKIEVQATAYIGQGGQTSARVEGEYEMLLTNRLVLQPLVEANLFGKDDPGRGVGAGLSTLEVGLRLRYEITRQFAPYIGLVRERAFGQTADMRRADGEGIGDTRFVAGLRIWY
jgi:copper resistance protein B